MVKKLVPVGAGAGTFKSAAKAKRTAKPIDPPVRERRMPMTPAEIDEAANLYRAGLPIRAIATQLERAYGTIHRVLTEAGVEMRPRTGK